MFVGLVAALPLRPACPVRRGVRVPFQWEPPVLTCQLKAKQTAELGAAGGLEGDGLDRDGNVRPEPSEVGTTDTNYFPRCPRPWFWAGDGLPAPQAREHSVCRPVPRPMSAAGGGAGAWSPSSPRGTSAASVLV